MGAGLCLYPCATRIHDGFGRVRLTALRVFLSSPDPLLDDMVNLYPGGHEVMAIYNTSMNNPYKQANNSTI